MTLLVFGSYGYAEEHIPWCVPDWASSTPTVIAFHNSDNNSFNACKGYPYVPTPSSPEVLLVRGKIVSNAETWINHPFEKHYFMNLDRGWLAVNFHYERLISTVALGSKHSITREKILKAPLAEMALFCGRFEPLCLRNPQTPR